MSVVVANLLISCLITQPNGKGTYETYLKAYGYNDKYFVVESGDTYVKNGETYQEVTAIDRKKCRTLIKE